METSDYSYSLTSKTTYNKDITYSVSDAVDEYTRVLIEYYTGIIQKKINFCCEI